MEDPVKLSPPGSPAEVSAGLPEKRRPYESPAIEETSHFETLALACGQNVGGPASCTGDPYTPGDEDYDNS